MLNADRLKTINGLYSRLVRERSKATTFDTQREVAKLEVGLTLLGFDPESPKLISGPVEVAE